MSFVHGAWGVRTLWGSNDLLYSNSVNWQPVRGIRANLSSWSVNIPVLPLQHQFPVLCFGVAFHELKMTSWFFREDRRNLCTHFGSELRFLRIPQKQRRYTAENIRDSCPSFLQSVYFSLFLSVEKCLLINHTTV